MVIAGARIGFYHVAFPDYSFHRRPFSIRQDATFHLILEVRIYERAEAEYARREARRREIFKKEDEVKRLALAELKKEMGNDDNQRDKNGQSNNNKNK